MSIFAEVPLAPPVAVFKLTADYRSDENPKKVNLGVGAYRTDAGVPWVLPVVSKIEKELANDATLNHEYLPIAGLPDFCSAAAKLALGDESAALAEGRAGGVQSLSGTGALRLSAEFLFRYFGGESTTVFYSNPTWGNHLDIYKKAGFTKLVPYTYWDGASKKANTDQFVADLQNAPEKSVILFHACAHNPTGSDPSVEDWKRLAEVCKQKGHFPIFDTAYQGFASGDPDKDAWSLRYFAEQGFEMMVCQSFSKNFGLYNERAGNLVFVVKDANTLKQCKSQTELIVRAMYSNPPAHGARIVSRALNCPELKKEWYDNIQTMSSRILLMRAGLQERLEKLGTPGSWSHITEQIGMFSFTGLNSNQCAWLIKERSIYLMSNGRINMCGLTTGNIDYIAEAIDYAVRNIE